ncbi:MAG: hypothetical protein LKK51_06530 [Eubacterium sp.]|jgi:hypothetical protein|uniref:DUF6904 family protein n=1 Tax=Eubacterium sp. F2 TaxID=3381348 RepID=UPI003907FD39|nr:hypothetical protein [Eubacterium sp.]MCI2197699.1 hypothetical protein [Eubacterium sp.]
MISAKPTEHLTGVTIEGEYEDLYEMVESIYRMTGLEEDYDDCYWGVKNRLLGICYDIRHAFQGDRNVKLVDNGANDELMKWHSMAMPQQNLHYSVEVLFPEALFVAFSVQELYLPASADYGERARKLQKKAEHPRRFVYKYADYIRDQAMLGMLSSVILSAFAEVIGDEDFEKVMRLREKSWGDEYAYYATQYVDKCNIEYLKTAPAKRKDKIRIIAKRLLKKPDAYIRLLRNLKSASREYGCSIHELQDPRLEYPDNIVW